MNPSRNLPPDNYPDLIFTLRRRLNLTQEQFAFRIGVSFASVNRWENGQNRPTRSAWSRMMRLSHGELPPPIVDKAFRVFPEWNDRLIRVNISQVVSYRQPRQCDVGRTFKPDYELHEYTVLFMNGGHRHIVHLCEVEIDKIFGVDPVIP